MKKRNEHLRVKFLFCSELLVGERVSDYQVIFCPTDYAGVCHTLYIFLIRLYIFPIREI